MSSNGDGGEWAASESKDWKDGRHKRENRHVADHGGIVKDSQTRRHLTVLRRVYERAYSREWIDSEWPDELEETDLYQDRMRYHETETFSDRLDRGELAKVRHHVGSQSDEIDVSGWHDIERIRDIVSDRHLRLYEYGEPGSGKTSAGCLAARHWLEQQREQGHDDAYIITNIRTLAGEDESIIWVDNWADLKERVYADMDDVLQENVSPVLFLFDEASSQASGGGKDGWETGQKLATLVYKIRKFGGAIIIIGHDGKDLHPAVRELCIVLHKASKKQARFYETITNRNPKQPITPEIEGWPDSKWTPNDKDPAPWSWSDGQGDDSPADENHIAREDAFRELAIWTVIQAKTCSDGDPPSNADVANQHLYGSYSPEWVRQRWNEYQDGEHGNVVADIQREIA
ncbi:ATP-binding protein [Natrialbaceae archaeon A-arb3/5]